MGVSTWFKRIKAKKPTPEGMKRFIGKTLIITIDQPEPLPVVVESIVGNMTHQARFEVNHKYFIVILDAFKQLENDQSITQQMIDDFDQTVCEAVIENKEREKAVKDLIAATQPPPEYPPVGEAH